MQRLFGVILIALALGCGGQKQPPTVKRPVPQAPATQQPGGVPEEQPLGGAVPKEEEPAEPSTSDEPAAGQPQAEEGVAGEESPVEQGDGEMPSAATVVAEVAEPPQPRERFVLLTPGGPLIVDALLRINGESHAAALEQLIDRALEAADQDGDGRPTWEELASSPRFVYGQFGNLAIENEEQRSQLVRMYDGDRDGLVARDELPRLLTRNAGGARSFSLSSSNEYRSDNRSRSPVRMVLDADRDGAVTATEMEAAPARLLHYDADDDEIVMLNDFQNDVQQMPEQMSNRRRTSEPDTALLVSERTNWGYAQYSLQELYAYGGELAASDWPLVPGLFAALDENGDQRLTRTEIARLAQVSAHLKLQVNFGAEALGERGEEAAEPIVPSLEVEVAAAEIEPFVSAIHPHGSRVSVELQDAEIEFFVNEDPSLANYEQVARQQLAALDADQNGYLDEDEFPALLPGFNVPLEGVDADGDGKVYEQELATFLELRQAAFRGQVRARAADQQDALFAALDGDGDGRLNAREIHHSPQRLRSLDRNGDGQLQSPEIPGSMVVGFIRGNPQQDNALFTLPPIRGAASETAPRWFRGMDANGDGEIGFREFLGPLETFSQLDADADGFLSAAEIAPRSEAE